MFEAQLLINRGAGVDYEVWGPWFPGGGDSAKFTIEVIAAEGSPNLEFSVYTKTKGTAGNGALCSGSGTSQNGTGTNTETQTATLKDLVRYRFKVTGTTKGDWSLFRMLPPKWFDEATVV